MQKFTVTGKTLAVYRLQVRQCTTGRKFWDDCGAWSGSSGRKVYVDSRSMSELRKLPDGLFGQRKRVDGSRILMPLDVQPLDVIEIHQLCSRLKRDLSYQRRITYISGCDFFLAEYLGNFPLHVTSHGNAVFATGEYVRAKPAVLSSISATLRSTGAPPKKVYQELKVAADNDQDCPRNNKQVRYPISSNQ